ncbi:MAG: AraC family transcriptional regulator [Pseudomonadota bacterium]
MQTPYLRGWLLQGLAAAIAAHGGDVDAYAARFRLPLRLTDNTDIKVPGEALVRLLEACATELACPDFGLQAGANQGPEALGPIALVAMHCATFGEAAAAVVGYLNLLSTAVELQVKLGHNGGRIEYELKVLRAGPQRQFEQWAMGIGLRMFRLIGAGQVRPKAILFSHAPLLELKHYTDFFGCPVKFSQSCFGAEIFAADIGRPVLHNDPQLKRLISDYIERIADPDSAELRSQIDLMVRKLLPTGRCNLISVAGHFHVSVSTLQRRLRADGVVFENLVDEARRIAAAVYLADPVVRLSQVAGLLGYANQSAFNHAFRRWHGASPREWRRACTVSKTSI